MDQLVLTYVVAIVVCCMPFSDGNSYHIHKTETIGKDSKLEATFSIKGEGIIDSITSDFQTLVDKESLKNGLLIIGDYRKNSVSAYSDQPGTMVVISGNTKKCQLRKYPESGMTTEDITEADCEDIQSRVKAAWAENESIFRKGFSSVSKKNNVVYTLPPLPSEFNVFVMTTEPLLDLALGQCAGSLQLVRGIMDYRYNLNCEFLRQLQLRIVFTKDGVVIGDYRADVTSWISDTPYELVIIDRVKGCEKLVYGKIDKKSKWGITNIGITDKKIQWGIKSRYIISNDVCEEYKTKMRIYLDDVPSN